jgi:DNA-binding LacI/PurR family transcriptional regulator
MLTWSRGRIAPVFEQALADLGMVSHPKWIAGEFNPALPGSGWEAFRDVWTALPEKPDGLLVTDDVLFRDAARAILELGIAVPERLKVATHANVSIQHTPTPFPHTRFEFDPQTDAKALADLLGRRMAGENPPTEPIRMPFAVVKVGEAETAAERSAGREEELAAVEVES